MGYDMRYRKKDEAEQAAVSAAADQFHAAVRERDALPEGEKGRFNMERAKELGDWDSHEAFDGRSDCYRAAQDKVHALYEAMGDAEKSYFRLNMFGMSRYHGLMGHIGMTFEDPSERPEWPKPEAYGTDDDALEALESPEYCPDYTWTDEALRAALKFQEDQNKLLSWHGAEIPGIPDHKFSSNDGWIVLPAECEAAVRIWRQFVADEGEEAALAVVAEHVKDTGYWLKWIEYLAGAVRRDGFEVH